jgi:hypothetical protein
VIRRSGTRTLPCKYFQVIATVSFILNKPEKKEGRPLKEILQISPDVIGAVSDRMVAKLAM